MHEKKDILEITACFPCVGECELTPLPRISEERGNLTFLHTSQEIPFEVVRVFYLYGVPSEAQRGNHAHRNCHQFLIALHGSFEVELFDGICRRTFLLDSPEKGLCIPAGMWASQRRFSADSICLVLASHPYEEADYIRTTEQYLSFRLCQ